MNLVLFLGLVCMLGSVLCGARSNWCFRHMLTSKDHYAQLSKSYAGFCTFLIVFGFVLIAVGAAHT